MVNLITNIKIKLADVRILFTGCKYNIQQFKNLNLIHLILLKYKYK